MTTKTSEKAAYLIKLSLDARERLRYLEKLKEEAAAKLPADQTETDLKNPEQAYYYALCNGYDAGIMLLRNLIANNGL